MQNNIFLVSDASYSYQTKIAGLGVVNLNNGLRYSTSKVDIKSSHDAEFRALLYSVYIALQNNLDNVIFVYDNLSLNLSLLKQYLQDKIETFQFLWLKREFVHEADRIAFKARQLRETLLLSSSPKIVLNNMKSTLKDKEILSVFRAKPIGVLFKACSLIADNNNKEIIYHFLNGTVPNALYPNQVLNYKFLNFIYFLLSKENKDRFCEFIERVSVNGVNKKKLKVLQKNAFYIKRIKTVLKRLKK